MLWTRKAPTLLKTLHQCPWSPEAPQTPLEDLKDSTEKLLLPKWVLWSRDRCQERIFLGMRFAVGHQVCSCLGHLYPIDVGFHLQLFYQFPGLCYAGGIVAGHWNAGWVFQTHSSVPKARGSLEDLTVKSNCFSQPPLLLVVGHVTKFKVMAAKVLYVVQPRIPLIEVVSLSFSLHFSYFPDFQCSPWIAFTTKKRV